MNYALALVQICLSILTNCSLPCHLTPTPYSANLSKSSRQYLFICYKRREDHVNMMGKSFLISYDNNDLDGIETTSIATESINKQATIIKILIIFLICAGLVVLITCVIGLVFVYVNCSRPSRIHKQIPIEYLDDTSSSSMSKHSDIENISTVGYCI